MATSPVQAADEFDVKSLPDERRLVFDDETLKAIAEVYFQEGLKEYRKKELRNAIYFFTEGIKVQCKDDELNTELLSNRATAHFNLGNTKEALNDARTALKLKPIFLRTTDCGNWVRIGNLYVIVQGEGGNSKEVGDGDGDGIAPGNLGKYYLSLEGLRKAVVYHDLSLKIAKEVKDRDKDETAGNACYLVSDFNIRDNEQILKAATELGDRDNEKWLCCSLGIAFRCNGDITKAIKYHELHLKTAKDVKDRYEEERAYRYLGEAYYSIRDYKNAIRYLELCLNIAKEVGDKTREGRTQASLGNVYQCIGKYQKAVDCFKSSLNCFTEVGDRLGEGWAYGSLGNAYGGQGDFQKAIDYLERCLKIVTTAGDKDGEGRTNNNLGDAFRDLGYYKKAIDYHEKALTIFKQLGNQAEEGKACNSLGNDYRNLKALKKAIHYHEKYLEIAKRMSDRVGEGYAYSGLANDYFRLGDFNKAINYHGRCLQIATEEGNKIDIGNAIGNLGRTYLYVGDVEKAKTCLEYYLKITQECDDRAGEAKAYYCLGLSFELLGSLENSCSCYQSSVKVMKSISAGQQFKDDWKITLRHTYKHVYTRLWFLLLKQGKVTDALLAADQGRAQALNDLMELNYGLETPSFEFRTLGEIIHDTFNCLPSVFTAVRCGEIFFWLAQNGKEVIARTEKISEGNSLDDAADYLQSLVETVREAIGVRSDVQCEDRSLEMPADKNVTNTGCDQSQSHSLEHQENTLKKLYDVTVSPIADLVNGDELIVIPEGPLWLVPYAAFIDSNSKSLCESFRIRMIPSLTSLKLLKECPADYHCKTGALLVGDPWVQEIVFPEGGKLQQLPCAREEVEMIGRILDTSPLTGSEATKHQVLKRLSSVALVHIAAHGRLKTGEIALAPNPVRLSQIPTEEDFLLTMTDVLNVKLRARLVVLSCCHSGRGEIKAEGVVGIARAFLGAGARSVLVSLWAIDDEATLEFMKCFYENVSEGRSASEALNRAMNYMRQSEQFSEVRFWAPFVLIGDDVTLDFDGRKETF